MKIAIMQPYFFPYLGYFDLMHNVDLFIVYDTVQYIQQGWINRNRILHPNKTGWQYISIPLDKSSFRNSYQTPILDVKATSTKPWKEHILGQLVHYEKNAPYAAQVIDFVKACLAADEPFISRLNVRILDQCARLLNLNFQYHYCSELAVDLDSTRSPEERVLDICEFLGAKEYVNLPGGAGLYNSEAFASHNIQLTFHQLPTFTYSTKPYQFEPHLSIIDLLMWNESQEIKAYLNTYKG